MELDQIQELAEEIWENRLSRRADVSPITETELDCLEFWMRPDLELTRED